MMRKMQEYLNKAQIRDNMEIFEVAIYPERKPLHLSYIIIDPREKRLYGTYRQTPKGLKKVPNGSTPGMIKTNEKSVKPTPGVIKTKDKSVDLVVRMLNNEERKTLLQKLKP